MELLKCMKPFKSRIPNIEYQKVFSNPESQISNIQKHFRIPNPEYRIFKNIFESRIPNIEYWKTFSNPESRISNIEKFFRIPNPEFRILKNFFESRIPNFEYSKTFSNPESRMSNTPSQKLAPPPVKYPFLIKQNSAMRENFFTYKSPVIDPGKYPTLWRKICWGKGGGLFSDSMYSKLPSKSRTPNT